MNIFVYALQHHKVYSEAVRYNICETTGLLVIFDAWKYKHVVTVKWVPYQCAGSILSWFY